jgi:hypothetical protein
MLFCRNVFNDCPICDWMDRFRDGIQKLFNYLWFPTHVSQNIFTPVHTEINNNNINNNNKHDWCVELIKFVRFDFLIAVTIKFAVF